MVCHCNKRFFCVCVNLGAQDAAAARIQDLEAEVRRLESEIMQLRIGHSLSQFQRFCASDEDIRFYTRFPSEEVFQAGD